jgi:membrane protease YdiL (CAAX protease family)
MAEPNAASRLLSNLWTATVVEPLERIDRESRAFWSSEASRRIDWKVPIVLVTAAISLSLLHYDVISWTLGWLGDGLSGLGLQALVDRIDKLLYHPTNDRINHFTNWCVDCVGCYLVIPWLVVRFAFRQRARDYGVKLTDAFADWWIYLVMLILMVPMVLLASTNAHFLQTYPFYRLEPNEPLWPFFWRWELLYAVQFFCLEFFFRGFLVHGLKHRFGAYAIFAMVVPYCMIHFGKPLPETFASIIAGIALGFMSLKTRSIWLGTAIHVSVALGMDFASLWRKGIIP